MTRVAGAVVAYFAAAMALALAAVPFGPFALWAAGMVCCLWFIVCASMVERQVVR